MGLEIGVVTGMILGWSKEALAVVRHTNTRLPDFRSRRVGTRGCPSRRGGVRLNWGQTREALLEVWGARRTRPRTTICIITTSRMLIGHSALEGR